MNREKKQLVVVGVLAFLILGVGAFQFTRKDPPPTPAAVKEKPKPKPTDETAAATPLLYPGLGPLQPKDPFEVATFVTGSAPAPLTPPVNQFPGTKLNDPGKKGVERVSNPNFGFDKTLIPAGNKEIVPEAPPKPVFGYTLIGLIDGKHPMAVFDDGKGNQQLVEVGQSVGSSATVTQISGGKVRVKFNAETLVFNVGGNTNAK